MMTRKIDFAPAEHATIRADGTAGETPPLTVADAFRCVQRATDLSPIRKRDLNSALNQLLTIAGVQADAVPLHPHSVRALLTDTAAGMALGLGRRRNIRSLIQAVMRRLGVVAPALPPPNAAWTACLATLPKIPRKDGKGTLPCPLGGFARFCSARAIDPPAVTQEVLAAYRTHLGLESMGEKPGKQASAVRKTWNHAAKTVPNWPTPPLPALPVPGAYARRLRDFPASFQAQFNAFFDRLKQHTGPRELLAMLHQRDTTQPLPPGKALRLTSIRTRQDHLRWAASALVAGGVPIAQVTSLDMLVAPENVEVIVSFLLARGGGDTNPTTAHIAEMLRILAKYAVRLPPERLAMIRHIAGKLKVPYCGMTAKNVRTIETAMTPAVEKALLELPVALLTAAQQTPDTAPQLAARLAMQALALEMLQRMPLRLANLQSLRLDQHLHRADPRKPHITGILIPKEETKTGAPITLSVERTLSDMLRLWLERYRPHVTDPGCVYLFPGHGTGNRPITPQAFRERVKEATRKYAGVTITPHQFRHLAAKRYLDQHSGDIGKVAQLLGHASVETTRRAYLGSQQQAATKDFDAIILSRRHGGRGTPPQAKGARGGRAGGKR